MPPEPVPSLPSAYGEIDFPLEEGAGRLRAAFSEPVAVLAAFAPGEVAGVLAGVAQWAREGCWAVGFVAYEAAGAFDSALKAHAPAVGLPLAAFAVFRQAGEARARGEFLPGAWHDITPAAEFDAAVAGIRRGIADGDYYQVNYTTRLRAALLGDSLGFYDALRAQQAGAYCAYLDFGRWRVCSVSPELFFRWEGGANLGCRPMKGTAARSADAATDAANAAALKASAKDRAENLMIVDLIRNDLSRLAELGSVKVASLFDVEPWPTVWQMTSSVACRTRPGVSLGEVFGALFPCGSVTGAPKAAAMAAIERVEAVPRGIYCGAIGVVQPGGAAVFSVGIRTAVVDAENGSAECGIGSGIVMDSEAQTERAEWQAKRAFLDAACPPYELLETLRLRRGRYWLLRGHLARLAASAAALGFACDMAAVEAELAAVARRHAADDWRVRLRLAAGGTPSAEAFALAPWPSVARFVLATAAVDSANPWLRHKTTQRGLYDALAVDCPDVFDTLLWNERGELTEFTRGNLLIEAGGRRLTPALRCGLLPGVYRSALLAHGRAEEAVLTRNDLATADAVWFINSLRGAVRLRFDDARICSHGG